MPKPKILIAALIAALALLCAGCSSGITKEPDSAPPTDFPLSQSAEAPADSQPASSEESLPTAEFETEQAPPSSTERDRPAVSASASAPEAGVTSPPKRTDPPKTQAPKPVSPSKTTAAAPKTTVVPKTTAAVQHTQPPAPTEPSASPEPTQAPQQSAPGLPLTPPPAQDQYTQADFDRIIAEVTDYAESYRAKGFTFQWEDSFEFGWDLGWYGTPRIRYEGIEGTIELLKMHVDRIYRAGTDPANGIPTDGVLYKVVRVDVDGDIAFAVLYG